MRILFVIAVCCALAPAIVHGQAGNATVTGTVTDPSGAAIQGATVTIRNPDTGETRTTVSNETGNFNLPGLRPATYDVTVEMQGFRRHAQREFRIEVDHTARLDVQLEIGQVAEQVEVRGTAQLLHTENATVGGVIESKKIVDLPLNGRNFVQLALLIPGVNTGQPGAGRGGGISIGGARSEQNAFQLDGVSNTDQYDSGISFRPNVDAIQEFKIEVNNYSAEFGKGAGGQINVVTKSGTNQLHGSLWEFNRNNAVQARNFFDNNPAFATKDGRFKAPPFNQNQFGALASGPVIRNKTFFLGSYEGFRRVRGATGRRTVPSEAMRQGDFSSHLGAQVGADALARPVFANQIFDARTSRLVTVPGTTRQVYLRDPFPGNRVPADRIDPISAKILQMNLWPAPNAPGSRDARTGEPRQNYLDGRPNRNATNQYLARVDHRFTDNDSIYVRFGYNESDDKAPGNFPGNERLGSNQQRATAASYTKAIGATRVNDLRFGWTREQPFSGATRIAEGRNLVKELGIRGLPLAGPGAPSVAIAGFTAFSDPDNNTRTDQTWQLIDAFSFNAGRHYVKVGGEARKINLDVLNNPSTTRGSFEFDNAEWSGLETFPQTGSSFANFLLGLPRQKARRPGDHSTYLRAAEFAAFIQDDWKATPKLTINLGLRYQLYIPPKETRNHIASIIVPNFPGSFAEGGIYLCKDPQRCAGISSTRPILDLGLTLNDLLVERLPQVVVAGKQVPRSLTEVEKYDFGPRIGIAYRLTEKIAIRTGYGLFWDTTPASIFQDSVENIPHVREDQQSLSSFQFGPPVTEAFIGYILDDPPLGSFTPGPNTFGVGFRNSYMQHWNFGVQQQFGNSLVAEISYAGSKGTRLNKRENMNTREPRSARALISSNVHPQLRRLLPYAVLDGQLIPLDNWFTTVSNAFSNYHALMGRFEKRYSGGLTFINSFTYSKAISDAQPFSGGDNDTGNRIQDIFNKTADKGLAPYDHRLRFVSSFVWDFPFGRGRRFGSGARGVMNQIIGGWQVNGIAQFQTGYPITVRRSGDPLAVGTNGAVRPDMTCNPNLPRGDRTIDRYFRTDCFVAPPDRFGNAGRSTVEGPGQNLWDLSVLKNFPVTEKTSLQLRGEFFNALNRPQWNMPGRDLGASGFGVVTSAQDPRIVQFGLKLNF